MSNIHRGEGVASTSSTLKALYDFTDSVYHARSLEEIYDYALEAITRTLCCDRASILLFDDCGVMRFVASRDLSESYQTKLSGHSPWQPTDRDPSPIFVSDIATTDEPEWIKQEIQREGIVSLGFVPLTQEGQVIGKFMTYYSRKRSFDAEARSIAVTIARQLGFSIVRARLDAARAAAIAELSQSEARFRHMTEEAPIMIWMSNPRGHCEQLNRSAREFWGIGDDELDGFDYSATIHPDDYDAVLAQMGDAIQQGRPVILRGRYRNRDNKWRLLQTEARPRFDSTGIFVGMIGVNVDITEQESIARQRELMLGELNHRVKNTLAVVQAIAQQTFKVHADLPPVEMFLGRLRVLARVHEILSGVKWESTALEELVPEVLGGMSAPRGSIVIDGPAILLPPKQALAIAIALHELQTNSLKYGALSVTSGIVSITWRLAHIGRLEILWKETGGPPVAAPLRRGFGRLMLEQGLKSELNGETMLEFRPDGLLYRIDASLEVDQT